jgi:hypothetical protein
MSDSSVNWYVRKVGEEPSGPFTYGHLVDSAAKHRVDQSVVVRHETATQGEWVPALSFDEIAQAQKYYQTAIASEPFERTGPIRLSEFEAIKDGMSFDEVVSIVGQPTAMVTSHMVQGVEAKVHIWKAGILASATMTFQDGRLFSKSQVGLR